MFLIAACAFAVSGVATAMACDSAKKASAEQANSTSCTASAKTASAGNCAAKAEMASAGNYSCSASAMAACLSQAKCGKGGSCSKTAMAMANLEPFSFVKNVNAENVAVGVSATENGFAFVFAGLTADHVAEAKQMAANGVASMNTPAHCAMTRGAMAEKAGGCETTQACLKALADAEIVLTETPQGAVATVSSTDEAKVKELHAFLAQVAPTAAEGSE
jgi:hypothetical protein